MPDWTIRSATREDIASVLALWRTAGLATALLGEGERRLRARRAFRLTAIVADDDPVALDFWQAAGYLRQQHRARFIQPPDE